MKNHFYVTLPSNSSMGTFPDNKITHFKTQLSQRITLEGEWEVGLVEIHYPYSFNTISHHDFWVGYQTKTQHPSKDLTPMSHVNENSTVALVSSSSPSSKWTLVTFPEGAYPTMETLLAKMREDEHFKRGAEISIQLGQIHIKLKPDVEWFSLSEALQTILGLPAKDFKGSIEGLQPPRIDALIPTQMYLYCDLLEPQVVGDTQAPLLRIVNVEKNKHPIGSQIVNIFPHVHYTPVLKRSFQEIEIDIRTDLGEHLPFMNGLLNVKLHFRKID